MQTVGNPLLVTGGSDAQPLTSDTIAQMAPDRARRQMRGDYVTTVVDEDAEIGGDTPTRFVLSESEELVASDGHHITLHPGAVSGVTTSGRRVDGLMLSGKKVRDEYPSHWLNSAQWQRFRAEALNRGELVFEGVRRLRVQCGSTAVGNNRPIFLQRPGFGGGAFFATEAFVEAQLADDYLLLDDGIPVDSYTAEFYKKRPFIGVRPDRIRPGEVFDLTITVCDPESFDNLLIARDDGLRTPDVRVKVNDVDITPALAQKFASFNPFGFPSGATSPYPGFRLVWPQMRIDEEMPLQIAVEVRDALGNVNQTVRNFSIEMWEDPVFKLHEFPLGLYGVPPAAENPDTHEVVSPMARAKAHRFNLMLPDPLTCTCGTGPENHLHGYQPNRMMDWLDEAKSLGLRTMPGWLGSGDWACPANSPGKNPVFGTGWQDRLERAFREMDQDSRCNPQIGPSHPGLINPELQAYKDKIDIYGLPDEPIPINTGFVGPDLQDGCSREAQAPCAIPHPHPDSVPVLPQDKIYLADYIEEPGDNPQVFFGRGDRGGPFPDRGETRVLDTVNYLIGNPLGREYGAFSPGRHIPLFLNLMSVGGYRTGIEDRNTPIWAAFMQYCHYFSVDVYPDMSDTALTEIAYMLDWMHECRGKMWDGGDWLMKEQDFLVTIPNEFPRGDALSWGEYMCRLGLPKLWFVLRFGDWWMWDQFDHGESGRWHNDFCDKGAVPRCPSPDQYVAMTYLAITHGAKGLLYFYFPLTERDGYRPPDADASNDYFQYGDDCFPCLTTFEPDETGTLRSRGHPCVFEKNLHCDQQWRVARNTNYELRYLAPKLNSPDVPTGLEIIEELCAPDGERTQPTLKQLRDASTVDQFGYDFAIHCPGRKQFDDEILLKSYGSFYYLIAVNIRNETLDVTFKLPWIPGYHEEIPAMELPFPIFVVFEKRAVLEVQPPEQMEYVLFTDRFEPYQRHIYQIPIPPGHRPQAPIGELLNPQTLALERLVISI